MIPFTRAFTVLMFVALFALLIVPMALQRHQPWLLFVCGALLLLYLAANIVLWRRMKPRA